MQKKIRILLSLMGLEIGGAETHAVELAKYLSQNGFLVYVVSSGGVYEQELLKYGIKHFYAPLTSKRPDCMLRAYRTIKRVVLEHKIDLIHAHARIPAFVSSLVHKRLHVPFMTTVHGVYSTSFLFKLFTNWGQEAICVSKDIKQYLIKNYNFSEDNAHITINGVDTEKFAKDVDTLPVMEEFGICPDDFKLVYVSRLDGGNCTMADDLIDLVPSLIKEIPNLKVIMVGSGDQFERLKAKSERTNAALVRDTIVLAGSRTDVYRFTALADVFVGISRAALEAMSAQAPVILGGEFGYIGPFCQSQLDVCLATNFTCRGCDPLDKGRLAKDILEIYRTDAKALQDLGCYGREVVLKTYSVKTMAEDNIRVYHKLLKANPYQYDFMISGYYGFKNSGDDTLLWAMIETLKSKAPDLRISVLSKNPEETCRHYGVDAINRLNLFQIRRALMRTKVLLSGGGSLIQDVTSTKSILYYLEIIHFALKRHVKVMVYANGIGPINRSMNRRIASRVLNRVNLITLRERGSKELLLKMQVTAPPVVITADPAFTLNISGQEEIDQLLKGYGILPDEPLIGVSVRNWKKTSRDFCAQLAAQLDNICQTHSVSPLFLPMQFPSDYEFSKRVASHMRTHVHIIDTPYSGNILSGIIRRTDFMIAMRLHALIYSASAGVPIIGLVYDPKVKSFLEYIGQPYYVDVSDIECEKLAQTFDHCYKNRLQLKDSFDKIVAELKEKALQNAEMAIDLLNGKEVL